MSFLSVIPFWDLFSPSTHLEEAELVISVARILANQRNLLAPESSPAERSKCIPLFDEVATILSTVRR